ncbi:MAG TPA: DUF2269 family protein [Actinomycetota bacterium]
MDDWLVFLHILAAIVWMGSGALMTAVITRANRNPDRTVVARLSHDLEWVGPVLVGPSAAVVVVLGIWLTLIEDWIAFSQTWIWLSLVLVAVSMGLGMGYFGPEGKRIGRIVAERGAEDPEVGRRMGRMLALNGLDLMILAVVLWLMVFKPGA